VTRLTDSSARPVTDEIHERMVRIRRDLHRHPELSWEENRTADRICAELDELEVPHRRVGGTGVIADLPGAKEVEVIALRADMDALPIIEETGLSFSSEREGVMHACAHDGHISMLLGAARLLHRSGPLPAPVRLIFQPGEEQGNGAERMVAGGALEEVAMIFGGHLDRHFQTGALIVTDGVVNASTDTFRIRITGQEGHAGRPHEALDAVVVGSLIVMAIQTIVSREIDPDHPSVVTIGQFHAGRASNIIAGRAILEGTIRAQELDVREHLMTSLQRIAESVGRLHQADVSLEFGDHTPPVVNEGEAVALAREAAESIVDSEGVTELVHANMGGEDFSCYLETVPGCYIRFGAQVPGREGYPAHSSRFDFDEEALAFGAAWFAGVAEIAGRAVRGRG
jgi:hippurate hydrolase